LDATFDAIDAIDDDIAADGDCPDGS